MKKPILILSVIISLFLIGFVSASSWCYQETANVSTSCGGLDTGSYTVSGSSGDAYMYIDYYKPSGATNNSLWNIKGSTGYSHGENKSIQAFMYNCWDINPLQFKIWVSSNSGNSYVYGYCYDGAGWNLIYTSFTLSTSGRSASSPSIMYDGDWNTNGLYFSNWYTSASGAGGMFEEALVWDILPITIISPTNNQKFITKTVNFNITTSDDMDACRWSPNSGVTNYSMNKVNSTYFYWTNTTMNEGTYTNTYFYCNQSSDGSWITSDALTFSIDSINPSIRITSPVNNSNSTNPNLVINYTRSDTHLSGCWWNKNNGANSSFDTNCANITGQTWSQGSQTVYLFVNDTYGNFNQTSVTFTIDSIPPALNITYPANNSNYTSMTRINYTYSDSHSGSCWYSFDNGVTNSSIVNSGTNFTGVSSSEGTNNLKLYCNDSFGNVNQTSRVFLKDSINPSIRITSPANGTNSSNIHLYVNYTVSDLHLSKCWWTGNGSTNPITCGTNITSTWSQGLNTITVYSNDTFGNQNSSNVSFFIDSIAPSLTITSPNGQTYITTTIPANFTVSDSGVGLSTCWWRNETGNNITLSSCTNFTFTQTSGTSHHFYFWANDTLGNTAYSDTTYTVSTSGPPAVNLVYPTNYINTRQVDFNFTAQDPNRNGIKNCSLYGNWTGVWAVNQTNTTLIIDSNPINYNFKVNISDGFYKWNVICFEQSGAYGSFADSNQTFGVDTVNPSLTISSPLNQTYTSNQISLTYIAYDLNRDSCWYNINNTNNISTSCNNIIFTASQGSSILRLFVNDSVGNINQTNVSFFVDSIDPIVTITTESTTGAYINYNQSIGFNITETDSNLAYCWYKLDSGVNESFNCGDNLSLSVSEGSHILYVYSNDTLGNTGSDSVPWTSIVTYPKINNINIITVDGSKPFTFNANITSTFLSSCKYTIFNSLGNPDSTVNKTLSPCSATMPDTVSNFGNYVLTIYADDLAGNENSSSESFTISSYVPPAPPGPGGGGDNTPINITEIINKVKQGTCGDGIANESFMYQGKLVPKDIYNCPQDVPGYNLDEFFYSLTIYCFQKENQDKCFWTNLFKPKQTEPLEVNTNTLYYNCLNNNGTCFYKTSWFIYIIIGILVLILALSMITVKYEGRKVKAYQYIAYTINKRRKRRI